MDAFSPWNDLWFLAGALLVVISLVPLSAWVGLWHVARIQGDISLEEEVKSLIEFGSLKCLVKL